MQQFQPGHIREFRFSLTAFVLIVIIDSLLIMTFIAAPERRTEITFTAAILAASGAMYSAYYHGVNMRTTLQRDRIKNSFAILDNLNKIDMVAIRRVIERGVNSKTHTQEQIHRMIMETTDLNNAVTALLGLFEDVSLSIQVDHADEVVLYMSLKFMVIKTDDLCRGYVDEERRIHGHQTLYQEHRKLADQWRNGCSLRTNKAIVLPK